MQAERMMGSNSNTNKMVCCSECGTLTVQKSNSFICLIKFTSYSRIVCQRCFSDIVNGRRNPAVFSRIKDTRYEV